jgi:hypothetical protein
MTAVLAAFMFMLQAFKPFEFGEAGRSMLRGVQCLLLSSTARMRTTAAVPQAAYHGASNGSTRVVFSGALVEVESSHSHCRCRLQLEATRLKPSESAA